MTSKFFTSLMWGAAVLGVTMFAAMPAPADQAPDKNGPGVARVSIIQGSAVVQRGDSHTQTAAVRNAPLLPGDYISTGKTSRAELQFDGYTAVRLGGNVQARITNNDPNNREMQLADGTVEVGMVRDGQRMQIETPSVTVRAEHTGDYRVTIAQDGSTWVTVRRGHADVVTPQRSYSLEEGRTLVARGSAENPSINYVSAVAFDSFDDFNAQRDQTMLAALNASPNLNPSIAGYDNLDAYGQWQDIAGYGQAWVPQQSADWAPYRDGSWVWEGGYGWTWVGSEPWGWAPYHYGRWFYANGYGWAWYPPAYGYAQPWSPALVGFFGFGAGVSVGFGFPYLGWCPLAPFEPFYPWYPGWAWTGFGWGFPYGYGYGGFYGSRVVNVTRITNINIYRNFRHGGASGTAVGRFSHGTITGHTIAVTSRNLGGRVGTVRGALPIRPTRNNLGFAGRTLRAPVAFSKRFDSARFASNRSLAARTSFAQQQGAIDRAIHGTVGRTSAPVNRIERANAPVSRSDNAMMRGNESARNEMAPATRANANASAFRGNDAARRGDAPSQSWQRFNQWRGNETRMTGSETRMNSAPRADRSVTGDSWGRFSQDRGSAGAPVSGRGSYGRNQAYGNGSSQMERSGNASRGQQYGNAYSRGYSQRDSYSGSARGTAPSYSRQSYPSYPREAYPSYSRGESYPSYSRGSYGSAPARQSAPSSYSRGPVSAPRQGGDGGGMRGNGGGGGGGRGNGGGGGGGRGRPPQ